MRTFPRLLALAASTVTAALAACAPPPVAHHDVPPPPPPAKLTFAPYEGDLPAGRWGFLAAPVSDGAYVFGGAIVDLQSGLGTVLNTLVRLDTSAGTVVETNASAALGTPAPRYCGCAAMNTKRNELLVLGGRNEFAIREAWILDVASGAWTQVQGDVPGGSVGCSVTFLPDSNTAYSFGGGSDSASFNETWKFDGAAHTFTALTATGPSKRYDQALKPAADGSAIYLVGGAADAFEGFSAQVWRFDVATAAWTMLADDVAGGPSGRRTPWTALSPDGAQLLVGFGVKGMTADSSLGDLWMFDLATKTWSQADVDGDLPPARGFSQWLHGPDGTAGLLFSGTDMAHTLDDAWVLKTPDGSTWN